LSETGDRLKKYRESIPKTLDELAEETGIPKSNLGYYETKGQGIPVDAREKLKAYGAPIGWIMTGDGEDPCLPTKGAQRLAPGDIDPAMNEGAMDRLDQVREASRVVFKALHAEGLKDVSPETEDWLVDQFADGLAAGRTRQQLESRLALALELLRKYRQGKAVE
jgi:transcriptional regulator with XRE-family HTH domain